MSITTYSELKSAIADTLNRDDLGSAIPIFIALAEAQINREVRHWRQEKRVETTLNEQYENLPDDFVEMLEMSVDNDTRLQLISVSDMQSRKQNSSTAGRPRYFRFTAGQIEFYPAPDTDYTLSMQYYAKTDALSGTNTSNWILVAAPDAYLYGALVHAAPYLQDDARIQVWAALYQSAIDAIERDNTSGKFGGPLRMGVPR